MDDADVSHGLLLAILVAHGGSVDLDADQFYSDAMGNQLGEFYSVQLTPFSSGKIRLEVVPA